MAQKKIETQKNSKRDKELEKKPQKAKSGRKPKVKSNEEFPFSIPQIEEPRAEIALSDILDSEKNHTMNEFLFEAALSTCQTPKHVKNLLTGLQYYQKKWFELGTKDSTSFLGDLGVLYTTEAHQLIEEQMNQMSITDDGKKLLRYVDPLSLNLNSFDLNLLERKEWSKEIPLFFDLWNIARKEKDEREIIRENKDYRQNNYSSKDNEFYNNNKDLSPIDITNSEISPFQNLTEETSLEIEKLERENYNLKREIRDKKENFKGSAFKKDFEMIWSSFQQARENLKFALKLEKDHIEKNIFKDRELEDLLGINPNSRNENSEIDPEDDNYKEKFLDSLRGKISEFEGFQSKYKKSQKVFLKDHSKDFLDSERKLFENVHNNLTQNNEFHNSQLGFLEQ